MNEKVDTPMTAQITRDGTTLVLTCAGSAESAAFDHLTETLANVHKHATSADTKMVIADVRSLEFASSACLKAFVSWLQRVQELEDHERYTITFKANPHHSWQRRSLTALKAFASAIVEIQTD